MSILLFIIFLLGVAVIGFFAGYFFNSLFQDIERRDVEMLEKAIVEKDKEITLLKSIGKNAGTI